MLPPIVFPHVVPLLIFLSFMPSGLAQGKNQDLNQTRKDNLSWIKDLNTQAEKLSKTHQEEARAIIEGVAKSAAQQSHCNVTKSLMHQAEENVRKNFQSTEDEQRARYPQLLIFVSFSMPLEVIKALAFQASQVGGRIVLRGLVNGNFKDTAGKLKELQEEVMIDPTLFEAYEIKHVPTFVLQNKTTKLADETVSSNLPPKDSSAAAHDGKHYDRLSGNVSLEYALEQFASDGATSQEAASLLKILSLGHRPQRLRKKP